MLQDQLPLVERTQQSPFNSVIYEWEAEMASADLPVYADQLPRVVSTNGMSIREDLLYTDAKGRANDRVRNKADALLDKWRASLPGILEPNETVFYIVRNCQAPVSPLEQLFLGIYAYSITSTTIVLTNLRLIHLGTNGRGNWRRTLKSVRWPDLAEAKVKGWLSRVVDLKYANGKKDRYWRVQGKDGKKVKAILAAVMPASRSEAATAQGMISQCPDCRVTLTPQVYRCNSCGLVFKDEKTLLKRTLLIPGGGYLYSGFTVLGVLSLFFEGLLFIEFVLYALMAAGVLRPGRMQDGQHPDQEALWFTAGIFLLIIGFQKALEYLHGRRVIRTFLPLGRMGQSEALSQPN